MGRKGGEKLIDRLWWSCFLACLLVKEIGERDGIRAPKALEKCIGVFGYDIKGSERSGWEVFQVHRYDGRGLGLNGGCKDMPVFRITGKRRDERFVPLNQHPLQGEELLCRFVEVRDLPRRHPARAQEVARHLFP